MASEIALSALDFQTIVKAGARVAWGQGGAEPTPLVRRLAEQSSSIGPFKAFVGISLAETIGTEHLGTIDFLSYTGAGNRRLGRWLDILVSPYSSISRVVRPLDVLLVQAARRTDGEIVLSIADEYLGDLVDDAGTIIVELNALAPVSSGAKVIPEGRIGFLVRTERAPLALQPSKADATAVSIGERIAELVEDGSVLQLGIGGLPQAVLPALRSHRNLGIHSGAIGDGVVELMQAGVVNNKCKAIDTHKTVTGLLLGSSRLYDYTDGNPSIELRSTSYTHNPDVLAKFEKLVAVNAAIEVDLTGQINAEVAANTYIGAVGGAAEFLRAAAASKGGLPIIVLPSRTKQGLSRIVKQLSGPVSTSRSDAAIVVTEYGAVDLRGRSLRERKRLLIEIAAPEHRESLDDE